MTANALVGSRLDYFNSLFRSLSALDLRKLQCVQNSLARIFFFVFIFIFLQVFTNERLYIPSVQDINKITSIVYLYTYMFRITCYINYTTEHLKEFLTYKVFTH